MTHAQIEKRYWLIQERFAAMTPAQQRDFLALLGIYYFETTSLSRVIDDELEST